MTSITVEATKPLGRQAARRGALEELLRPRPDLVDVHPADRAARRVDQASASRTARGARSEPRRVPGRRATSARPPSCSTTVRDQARAARRPAPTATSPATSPLSYGLIAAAQQAKLPIFYASYPITPASDILHELSKLKNFGVKHAPGRGRDRRGAAPRSAPRSRAASASPATSGPGLDLKSEARRARDQPRAPARPRRRAARWPVDRPAHQDRAGRPPARRCTAGTARRRCRSWRRSRRADCFDAAFEAVRLALKYRTPVILLTDGYLANGASRGTSPTSTRCPTSRCRSPSHANHGEDFWPYLRDPETLSATVGGAGHPEAHAPHRRPREGRRHPATSATSRRTTRRWCASGRPRSPASRPTSRRSPSTIGRRCGAAARVVGRHVGRSDRGGPPHPRRGAARSRTRTSSTSTRSRPTSVTSCGATERSSSPS